MSGFNWLNAQNLEADWVIVTDDDCFMNVNNVFDAFKNLKVSENDDKIFCGFVYSPSSGPNRWTESKWYQVTFISIINKF